METEFHEGVNHDHRPAGRWAEIQANPNSPGGGRFMLWLLEKCEPPAFCWWAKGYLWASPLSSRHVEWYLKGSGADYNEDAALKIVLEHDTGIRAAIGRRIPASQKSGVVTDYFKLEPKHYGLDDARSAWGAIDRFDFEADYDDDKLHVWFKDRYEWHPYYPGIYHAHADDAPARETNCVHAAFVEMKSRGAADYWMVGEATVPLKPFIGFTVG